MKTFAFRMMAAALTTGFLALGDPSWGQTAQSNECKARIAALSPDSVPTSGRPGESPAFYEAELRKAQPFTGGLTAQQASKEWQQARDQRRKEEAAFKAKDHQLELELLSLKADLRDAENTYPKPAGRIAELKAQIAAKTQEKAQLAVDWAQRNWTLSRKENAAEAKYFAAAKVEAYQQILATLAKWEAYDNAQAAYKQADAAKTTELAAAQRALNDELKRVDEQRKGLQGRPRDEDYYRTVRDVRTQALGVFEGLKTKLLKYECWPEVSSFIVNELEPRILRLRPQTTALASDALDEELAGLLELPAEEDSEGDSEEEGFPGDEDEMTDDLAEGQEESWEEDEALLDSLWPGAEDEGSDIGVAGGGGGPCAGWTGQWDTSYGKMSLGGGSGSYDYHGNAEHAGTVTARKVEGNVLEGDWKQADGKHGTFRFEMDPTTGSFSGWWSYHNNFDGGGWSGKCLSGS